MENINVSTPNDGLGDKLRDAFIKVNDNFSELSSSLYVDVPEALQLKQNLPTGFLIGLNLSINNSDNTKYDIAEGYYVITDFTDLANIHSHIKYFPGVEGLSPLYLASANATYVAINEARQIIQSVSPFDNTDRRSLAILGAVIHSNNVNINVTNEIKAPIVAPTNQLHDLIKAIGSLNIEGNMYSPNGANLQLNKSAGKIFGLGINSHDYTDPHRLSIAAQTALTFRYRLRNGIEYSNTTSIDPNNYDLNGVLTAMPNNRWQIQHINLFQSGLTRNQYGQNVYQSLQDAENAIRTESFTVEQNIADNAIFRSYLIVKKGCTNLSDATQAKFIAVDKFGNVITGGLSLTFDNIIAALGYTPQAVVWNNSDNTAPASTTTETMTRTGLVQLLGSNQYIRTLPTTGSSLGCSFGHITSGGGFTGFVSMFGNTVNGGNSNVFIGCFESASTSEPQQTFVTVKSPSYNTWTDNGRLLFRFKNGYASSPQNLFDIGTDYLQFHKYPSTRNDGGSGSNYLHTDTSGTLKSIPVGNAPFILKDDSATYDTKAIRTLTQAEFNAISASANPSTLYFIV